MAAWQALQSETLAVSIDLGSDSDESEASCKKQKRGTRRSRRREERQKQQAEALEKLYAAGDADGDGMLSLDEAMAQGMDGATFKSIDADGNGQLTQEEFANWQVLHDKTDHRGV